MGLFDRFNKKEAKAPAAPSPGLPFSTQSILSIKEMC